MSCADLFLAFVAILFPPIAVWIKSGICTGDSFINIALCCLGYVPGLIHAWYIIARNPEQNYDYEPIPDSEAGRGGNRVTYYYVSHTSEGQGGQRHGGYGTDIPPSSAAHTSQGINKPVPPPPNAEQDHRQGHRPAPGPSQSAREAGQGAPPSYTEAVKGDNKIQRQD